MKAPLRPMLLVLGALCLGGVVVLNNAQASEPSTFDTVLDSSKAKDGGGWLTLADKGKEGGAIDLADKGKEGGAIDLADKGKEGGAIDLAKKGKEAGR
jgi:hypothetical protein